MARCTAAAESLARAHEQRGQLVSKLAAKARELGIDIALEALRDAYGRRLVTTDALVRAAEACRIYSVMKPYLQAVLA
jgi:hypothetical protein